MPFLLHSCFLVNWIHQLCLVRAMLYFISPECNISSLITFFGIFHTNSNGDTIVCSYRKIYWSASYMKQHHFKFKKTQNSYCIYKNQKCLLILFSFSFFITCPSSLLLYPYIIEYQIDTGLSILVTWRRKEPQSMGFSDSFLDSVGNVNPSISSMYTFW